MKKAERRAKKRIGGEPMQRKTRCHSNEKADVSVKAANASLDADTIPSVAGRASIRGILRELDNFRASLFARINQ